MSKIGTLIRHQPSPNLLDRHLLSASHSSAGEEIGGKPARGRRGSKSTWRSTEPELLLHAARTRPAGGGGNERR
jgi:hypothetical protein